MAKIDEVAFGKLVCDGKVYRSAVLVFPDKVDGRWWRKDGMAFSPEDFDAVIAAMPDHVCLGVGFTARVRVPTETIQRLEQEGIQCVVADTTEAVERYNELSARNRVIGAFHLL